MKSCNLATGSLSWNEENLFSGILPKRIVVGMVDAVSYEGAYNKNPFNFKHNNLKYCSLLLDGKMIPQKPIVCDFEKGNTLRNYFTLLESTGKVFVDDGLDIDRTEYENGYSLIAFDLTPDLSENGCYHLIKKGNIRLELKFDEALEQPVNLIIYSEFDSSISIDKNRAVITNFYT
jgi:ribonucleoside-diphosphate reductase beta chain